MAHTTIYSGSIRFLHNGDFSGDVTIINEDEDKELKIPFQALKYLVGEYVRSKKISEIEDADVDKLFGL